MLVWLSHCVTVAFTLCGCVLVITQYYFDVGGDSVGETPGPIPNPEAKPDSADGTALARVWESRTPPTLNQLAVGPLDHQGPHSFFLSG